MSGSVSLPSLLRPNAATPPGGARRYGQGGLSYAGTFADPWKAGTIRALEWSTGKIRLLRLIRQFEREGVETGPEFFAHALRVMGIRVATPQEQIARIPAHGPVVVVANHPHGLVDGLVLAEMVGRVRSDFRILTRSLLAGVAEVADHVIAVPFPHEADARAGNLAMRRAALAHLARGGLIVVFPAGAVASSETAFGPVIEKAWFPFTARMIRQSAATVVPVFFPGTNSRFYQIANRLSATFRQGLLLHEVVRALDRPQVPVIRQPIFASEWRAHGGTAAEFALWLRGVTLMDQRPIGRHALEIS